MRRRLLPAAIVAALLCLPGPSRAQGLFGGSSKLDPAYCRPHQIRQTVIYIDDTAMVDGQTGWALKLEGKLKASMIPGERVTVVRLSPASGESHEEWSGCWPDVTPQERAAKAAESHLFSRGPLARLGDQQRYFVRDFGQALTAIYLAGKRPAAAVRIDPADPPTRNLIRALASDEGRFAHSEQTIRAIIYSDMVENSDLGSIFRTATEAPVNYGTRLGTYLRRSVFYAFGLAQDVRGGAAVQDAIRSFWSAALRSMAATVGGFGTDLNIPGTIPVAAHIYSVELDFDGKHLDGRLTALSDADGNLVDSWIGITRLGTASLDGTLRCQGAADDQTCRIEARAVGGLTTTSPSEFISLSGRQSAGLSGRIGVKGSPAVFEVKASPAED